MMMLPLACTEEGTPSGGNGNGGGNEMADCVCPASVRAGKDAVLQWEGFLEGDSLVGAQDTLGISYDADDDTYDLDTIFIGDTVVFATTFYTYNSNLLTVELKWEKDFMNLWYPLTDDITKVLRDTSNIEDGKLYFESGYNRVSFPIYFTPKVQGGLNLKLAVESDSEFPISSVSLYIPAKERVVADSTIVE